MPTLLFSDTETRKNFSKQIVARKLPGNFGQSILHLQKLLRHKLAGRRCFEYLTGRVEMRPRPAQTLEVSLPGYHGTLARRLVAKSSMPAPVFALTLIMLGSVESRPAGISVRSILLRTIV
jgi:hypothetical protein